MHPPDCPKWEYDNHPQREPILKTEIKSLLLDLRKRNIDSVHTAADTRVIHKRLFCNLTPPDASYYAGHYRGEEFSCLKFNKVGIRGDPRVGYAPHLVPGHMMDLFRVIRASMVGLDSGFLLPHSQLPMRDKILYAVIAVCKVFEQFLRIHPYVNGNGHAARFIIWAMLGRYGIWPIRFPVDPRPSDPPYTDCITAYRRGDPQPLERFVFQCLVSN